jgi:small subunit ribosomal protein S8
MMTDPISDFLTRIRNGLMSRHETVSMPSSRMKTCIAKILKEEGYIDDCSVEDSGATKTLTINLKYDTNQMPVIESLRRISKPGLRIYRGATDMPEVRGGVGMAVVSTSRGVMTNADARKQNVGGEVLCYIW